MDRAHQPERVWWAPWRQRCSCGAHRWPCPDTLISKPPPPAYWLSLRNTKAHWIDEPAEPPDSGQPPGKADHDPAERHLSPRPADTEPPGPAHTETPDTSPEEERQRRIRQHQRWPR